MRVGDFELCVAGYAQAEKNAEIELSHREVYILLLISHADVRCDACVTIDGKHVGTWRIPANDIIEIQRPVYHAGRFTFFQAGSLEAKFANVPTDGSAGWIEAKFVPELRVKGKLFDDSSLAAAAPSDEDEAGGTGYTGKSEQAFRDADDIYSYDESAAVTIKLRLICKVLPLDGDEPFSLRPTPSPVPSIKSLRNAINTLAAEIKADRAGDDYLAPEHLDKMDRLVDLKLDLRFAKLTNQPAVNADYEGLFAGVFACPDCKKPSRIPVGSGRIRIKCPHCTCQFVRET